MKSNDYKYSALQAENKSHGNDNMYTTLHAIQSLDWVLPETRMLLEKQFRSELTQSKKSKLISEFSNSLKNFILIKLIKFMKLDSQYHVACQQPLEANLTKPKAFKANKKYKPKAEVPRREISPLKDKFDSFRFDNESMVSSLMNEIQF